MTVTGPSFAHIESRLLPNATAMLLSGERVNAEHEAETSASLA
jgi:hypothetical protein